MILSGIYGRSVDGQRVHAVANETLLSPQRMGYTKFCKWYYGDSSIKTFLFVRDPIDRLASAYRDKIARTNDTETEVPFERERKRILDWCVKAGVKESKDTKLSFADFLSFCAGARLRELNHHWAPQSLICWPRILRYTHVYSFDRFAEGVSHLMDELEMDADWVVENLGSRSNETSRGCLAGSSEAVDTQLRAALERRYAGDYMLLEYARRRL